MTRHILSGLSLHMSRKGSSCFPSIETLAEECGCTRKTVIKHLQVAKDLGWIVVRQHGYSGQRWKRHEYEARVPAGVEAKIRAESQGGVNGTLPPTAKNGPDPQDDQADNQTKNKVENGLETGGVAEEKGGVNDDLERSKVVYLTSKGGVRATPEDVIEGVIVREDDKKKDDISKPGGNANLRKKEARAVAPSPARSEKSDLKKSEPSSRADADALSASSADGDNPNSSHWAARIFARMLGYPPNDYQRRRIDRIVGHETPARRALWVEQIQLALDAVGGRPQSVNFGYLIKDYRREEERQRDQVQRQAERRGGRPGSHVRDGPSGKARSGRSGSDGSGIGGVLLTHAEAVDSLDWLPGRLDELYDPVETEDGVRFRRKSSSP